MTNTAAAAAVSTCYRCQKQGHWAANCPESPTKKFHSPNPHINVEEDDKIPDKECPCGAGTCAVLTSSTPTNPDRKFYKCPLFKSPELKCGFFEWCDAPTCNKKQPSNLDCPRCAGTCVRFTVKKENVNKGREFYRCLGQGDLKCGFFEWCDASTSNKKQPSNLDCPRCAGTCVRFTVKKENENKGREFYRCLGQGDTKCPFFHWCDEEMSPQKFGGQNLFRPDCSCGAGKCRRLTSAEDGVNKGRGYFICPVKKGQGACNFFQWEDARHDEPSVDHLGEREPLTSFVSTMDREKTNPYTVIVLDDDEVGDASSDGKQSESPSSVGCEVKEVLMDDVDAKNNVLPIRRPDFSLAEDERAGIFTKPANCFSCGREGHWMKDCIKANSICVKCGKFGHWKKDCTT